MRLIGSLESIKRGKKTKFIAGFITVLIIAMLIFSGPASALLTNLSVSKTISTQGEKISFIVNATLETNEHVPITQFNLLIYGPTGEVAKNCSFNYAGTEISGCTNLTIASLNDAGTWTNDSTNVTLYDDAGYDYNYGFGYGYGYSYVDATSYLLFNVTLNTTEYNAGNNLRAYLTTTVGADGVYQSIANDPILFNITYVSALDEVIANTSVVTFNNASKDTIVFVPGVYTGTEQTLNITSAIPEDQAVYLDLSNVMVVGATNISMTIPMDFVLTRTTNTTSYSVTIPNGTVVTSTNLSWDGKIELPTIQLATSFTSLSGYTGDFDVVISAGSAGSLTLDKATSIVLGGMANKTATWSSSTGAMTKIAACATANDTSEGTLTSGECAVDSANDADLIIWTFHLTNFGAGDLTEDSTDDTTTGSGGGSSITLTADQLTAGSTNELYVGKVVKFTVAGVSHSFFLTAIRTDSVSLRILSNLITATLIIGEEKKFDINTDGYYDLSVKLNSIEDRRASITLKSINESTSASAETTIPGEGETTPTETTGVGETITKAAKSWITWLVVAIIIVLAIISYIIYRRNNR